MDTSMFIVNVFGQGCLGFIIGVIAYQTSLFQAPNANWLIGGLAGTFGALIGTQFLKRTKYQFNNTANWIAASVGSIGIFIFYFVLDYWNFI